MHDINDPDLSTQVISMPDFPTLIDNLSIADAVGNLPDSIGGLFSDLADRLDDGVFGLTFPVIGDALPGPANFIRDIGETISDVWQGLANFDLNDLECAVEEAFGNVPCTLGASGVFDVLTATPDEVTMRLDLRGKLFSETVTLDTDLGLPRLGAELNTR